MRNLTLAITAAIVLCSASWAPAEVIYSNFGPGDAFNSSSARVVRSTYGEAPDFIDQSWVRVGMRFVPSDDYYLDSADVAVWNLSGLTWAQMSVYEEDPDTGMPDFDANHDALIAVTSFDVPSQAGVATAPFGNAVVLNGDTPYWLMMDAPGDSDHSWYLNSTGSLGTWYRNIYDYDPYAWSEVLYTNNTLTAFRVNGTLVPEPASAALLGLAGATLLLWRRWRK